MADIKTIFDGAISTSGDEELLRVASNFATQLTANQIKGLMFLYWVGKQSYDRDKGNNITWFADKLFTLLQYNHSDQFVSRIMDSISLRRFIQDIKIAKEVK